MLQIPPGLLLMPGGRDRISWIAEQKQGIWTAPHAGTLVSLLPCEPESLLDHFTAPGERAPAAGTLESLISMGLVVSSSCSPHLAELCREFLVDPQHLKRNRWLEGATLMAADAGTGALLGSALADAGVRLGPSGALHIVALPDYLDPRIEAMHRRFLESRQPWMLAKAVGAEIWIGPVILPGRTPCWRCLELRLREHRWLESQIPGAAAGPLVTPYSTEGRIRAAAEFIAQEAARWLMDAPDALEGILWSFSWETLVSRRNTVLRRPNCPDCGSGTIESAVPIAMAPRAVYHDLRGCSASDVFQALEPLASPIAGILLRFEPMNISLPRGMQAYGAVFCPALPPPERRLEDALVQPAVCAGTGRSREDAMAACLAEAVERYSIQFRGDEPFRSDSFTGLGVDAVDPRELLLFSESQFSARQPGGGIPEPFDEDEQIEWIQGWSLTHQRPRFLPLALCLVDYRARGTRWIGDADSTGCAAGSSIEEAILHGIFELVERDALGIWWYNRVALPGLGLEILDRAGADLYRQLAEAGWSVRLHDITTDIGIATAVALAENNHGEWVLGSAAHIHANFAMRDALCELLLLSRSQIRREALPELAKPARPWIAPSLMKAAPSDLKDLVEQCCGRIAGCGHEVIAFKLTRPDLGFPVVRVIAPGLRHKAPRFAPGRMYDVPVRLGWRLAPSTEPDLAQVPL